MLLAGEDVTNNMIILYRRNLNDANKSSLPKQNSSLIRMKLTLK